MSTLLLAAAAVAVAAAASDSETAGWGGPGAVTGQGPLPGVAKPPLSIPATTAFPAVSVTMAATQLHSNGTGALAQPPGAIVVLRTHIATLASGRHWTLRARSYKWHAGKYGDPVQGCDRRQWDVMWNLGADEVTWLAEPYDGHQECEPLVAPGAGNFGMQVSWSLDREGSELWLRATAVNQSDAPATYDLQSWATGGGDFP